MIEALLTSNITTNTLLILIFVVNTSMRHNLERALAELDMNYQKLLPVKWFPERVSETGKQV